MLSVTVLLSSIAAAVIDPDGCLGITWTGPDRAHVGNSSWTYSATFQAWCKEIHTLKYNSWSSMHCYLNPANI